MQIPKSLLIFLAILVVGFTMSVIRTKQEKLMRIKYEKIGEVCNGVNGKSFPSTVGTTVTASYQESAAVYSLPSTNKKDVTYCVIDDRLVNET
jgi:hypothetical protein